MAPATEPPAGEPAQAERDVVVEPGTGWSRLVRAGERVRVTDLHGNQAVDLLCYSAEDPAVRYCASDTMKLGGSLFLRLGTVLYSDQATPLMTIVEDSYGFHDTIGGCCSAAINVLRYGEPGSANCRDTFVHELARFGLDRRDVVANVNLFMYVPVEPDGTLAVSPAPGVAGEQVTLRADQDVIVVMSNCAQRFNPANGFDPTPVRVEHLPPAPDDAGHDGGTDPNDQSQGAPHDTG
ncbi:MAG: DUF1989 domain-containing protein [Acidimicrobiia bacterium]